MRHRDAPTPYPLAGRTDGPEARAPPDDEHTRVAVRVVDLGGPDVVGDAVDLRLPQSHHGVVVVRVVRDVAGDVGLLEPADAVLEAGDSWNRPRPGERRLVPQVRLERLATVR